MYEEDEQEVSYFILQSMNRIQLIGYHDILDILLGKMLAYT